MGKQSRYITITLMSHMSPIAYQLDGSMQQKRNSSALEMELRLSCTKPLNCLFNNLCNHMTNETSKLLITGLLIWKEEPTGGCWILHTKGQ